jgi:transposase
MIGGMSPRPSADFRERLVAALDAGLSRGEAAQHFGVSLRSIERWVARHRAGLPLADRPRSGRPPRLRPEQERILRALVLAQPDATLLEHTDRLAAATGIRYSPSHLSRILRRLDLPLKKSP